MCYIDKNGKFDEGRVKMKITKVEILAIVVFALLLGAIVCAKNALAFETYAGEKCYVDKDGYFTIEGNPSAEKRAESERLYKERMEAQRISAEREAARNDLRKQREHELELQRIRSGR